MARSLGITTLNILAAVQRGAAYGLDIVSDTGLASGTVYPALQRLQRRGLVESRWEDQRVADREGRTRRKYYRLTGEGARALHEGAERMRALAGRLAGTDAPDPETALGRGPAG